MIVAGYTNYGIPNKNIFVANIKKREWIKIKSGLFGPARGIFHIFVIDQRKNEKEVYGFIRSIEQKHYFNVPDVIKKLIFCLQIDRTIYAFKARTSIIWSTSENDLLNHFGLNCFLK